MSQTLDVKIELALEQLRRVREDLKTADLKTEQRFEKLERKIDDQYVTRREVKELEGRIEEIEDNHKWLVRTVIGNVITVIIGIIVAAIAFFKQ